jgi:spectinomycin phosphotransferase
VGGLRRISARAPQHQPATRPGCEGPPRVVRPDFIDTVRRFLAEAPPARQRSPARSALATVWRTRRAEIAGLLERTEALASQLAKRPLDPVLCHGDIHLANVLVDVDGRLRVVDWDGVVFAPRERDLMFVVGGVAVAPAVRPRDEALFFEGYGAVDLDPLALTYYRHAWALQEIGAFADETLVRRGTDETTRAQSLGSFRRLFSTGGVVDSANASWALSLG